MAHCDGQDKAVVTKRTLRTQVDIAKQNGSRWIMVSVEDLERLLAHNV